MEERRMLDKDGPLYVGARAVAVPARTGTAHEPTTRRRMVAADHESFTLDDGHTHERLSAAVWTRRYSLDVGTPLVRQARSEGAAPFGQLWRTAVDPAPRTPQEIAGLTQSVGPGCPTGEHGACPRYRPVLVRAGTAERRSGHHGGDPTGRDDVEAILPALDRLDPGHRNLPGQVFSRVLREHRHPAQEAHP